MKKLIALFLAFCLFFSPIQTQAASQVLCEAHMTDVYGYHNKVYITFMVNSDGKQGFRLMEVDAFNKPLEDTATGDGPFHKEVKTIFTPEQFLLHHIQIDCK